MKKRIYSPRGSISRYYLVLFSLPKWEYLAIVLIVTSLSIILLLGEKSIPILLNSMFTLLAFLVYKTIYRETVFWKIKRVLGLTLAVSVYSSIYTALTGNVFISIASSTALLTAVVLGLEGTSAIRYPFTLLPPILSFAASTTLNLLAFPQLVESVVLVLLIALLYAVVHIYISRRRINAYRLPDIGRLFLRNWLDKRTDIERVFEDTGVYETVHSRITEFPGFVVIYTDVHYGPFSNVGSSRLPEYLSRFFMQTKGVRTVALHGLGSHDRNIASASFVNEYMRNLENAFITAEKKSLMYYGSFILEYATWRALCIVFDRLSIVIISRPGKGIDDLPYELQEEYELKAKSYGLGDVVIVDAHNWELEENRRIREVNDLKHLLDSVLVNIHNIKRCREPVKVYSKFIWFKSTAPGLINGECCIFCIGGEGREEACIMYMRGNNMKPGARDKIIEKLRILGTAYTEVITNDEHGETATRSHVVYIPVHDTPELLKDVEEAVHSLLEMNYSEGALYWGIKMNLKLAGLTAFKLEEALKTSIRETAILLLLYVFATPIVVLTVLLLL